MSIPAGDEPGQAGWMNSERFLKGEGSVRYCDGCGEDPFKTDDGAAIPLQRCSRCHHAWYHNRECQLAHHPEHKHQCLVWSKTIKNEPRLESYPFVENHQEEDASTCRLTPGIRTQFNGKSATWKLGTWQWENSVYYQSFFLPTCFQNNRDKKVDIIMDFGCATGALASLMRDHATKVIAFDVSNNMIDEVRSNAKKRNWDNVEAVNGCITDREDPAMCRFREQYRNKVDLIVSSQVLPFVPHLQAKATFREFHDLLKPGGMYAHVDTSKHSTGAEFPNYITVEECETYYEWGGLEKVVLKEDAFQMNIKGMVMSNMHVFGAAKKNG